MSALMPETIRKPMLTPPFSLLHRQDTRNQACTNASTSAA